MKGKKREEEKIIEDDSVENRWKQGNRVVERERERESDTGV